MAGAFDFAFITNGRAACGAPHSTRNAMSKIYLAARPVKRCGKKFNKALANAWATYQHDDAQGESTDSPFSYFLKELNDEPITKRGLAL